MIAKIKKLKILNLINAIHKPLFFFAFEKKTIVQIPLIPCFNSFLSFFFVDLTLIFRFH